MQSDVLSSTAINVMKEAVATSYHNFYLEDGSKKPLPDDSIHIPVNTASLQTTY
jgi:hypothetical protein